MIRNGTNQARRFIALSDVDDADYSGLAGNVATVNGGETGLELVASSGGGAAQYDATIGAAGADYTTIKDALDNSKINLLAVDDVTETAVSAVPASGFSLHIPQEYTVDCGDYGFTYAASANVYLSGVGTFKWAKTGAARLFNNTAYSATAKVFISDLNLISTATAYGSLSGGIECVDNVTLTVTNSNAGFAGAAGSHYCNICLNGTGASAENALNLAGSLATNVDVTGTWHSATISNPVITLLSGSTLSGLRNSSTVAIYVKLTSNAVLQGFHSASLGINLALGTGAIVADGNCKGGTIDTQTADDGSISNVVEIGTLDLTATTSANWKISNCRISNAVTVAGDRHKLSNSELLGGASVANGAIDNGFTNCQFGGDAGGGALTITIVLGALRTRVGMCSSDAAIVNGEPTSELRGNTVY